jgi:hypothetical protein
MPADGHELLGVAAPDEPEVEHFDDDDEDVEPSAAAAGNGTRPLDVDAVEAEDVRALLEGLGEMLHLAIGDPDVRDHWRLDDDELDALTRPMTRIVNRRPKLKKFVQHGDGFLVLMHTTTYVSRNLDDTNEARKARGELDREAGPRARWRSAAVTRVDRRGDGDGLETGGGRDRGGETVDPPPRGPMG